mgnify:CR=1 FL=1
MSKIPTIAMIPSGYKANKLYSVLPTNGDGDLTTARTSTATRVNEIGLIEDVATGVPRLDYTGGGCPALLIEPQSTNYYFPSEGTDATLTSPYGSFGFYELGVSAISKAINYVGQVSVSFIVKRQDGLLPTISSSGGSGDIGVVINGSSLAGTGGVLTAISDGYYKYTLEDYTSDGTSFFQVVTYSANTTYVSLVQYENSSYATSYIPTSGSTATRVAETLSKGSLSSYINSVEGVLYAEMKALADNGDNYKISLSNGSDDNAITINLSSVLNTVTCSVRIGGGVIQTQNATGITKTDYNKIAFKYSENNFAIYINGVKEDELLSGSIFSADTLNKLSFDRGNSADLFYGNVKDLRVFNEALSDAELVTLTT